MTKDGHQTMCKSCTSKKNKEWYYKNHKRNLEVRRKWHNENKEYRKKYKKKWREENRDDNILYAKQYRKENSDKVKEYRKWYYHNHPNSPKNNKKRRDKETKRSRLRRKNDPLYKFKSNIRRRVCEIFAKNNLQKPRKTVEILGCGWQTSMNHIESQFVNGMSWENRELWHIDHIIPLSHAKNEKQLLKLCHYTNLQPLWAKENISKSNKILKKYKNNKNKIINHEFF